MAEPNSFFTIFLTGPFSLSSMWWWSSRRRSNIVGVPGRRLRHTRFGPLLQIYVSYHNIYICSDWCLLGATAEQLHISHLFIQSTALFALSNTCVFCWQKRRVTWHLFNILPLAPNFWAVPRLLRINKYTHWVLCYRNRAIIKYYKKNIKRTAILTLQWQVH